MGLRLQRRANLSKGVGLNISGSGVSPSIRTKYGSLSPKGFSIRTGIPGLSFRSGFGRSGNKNGGAILLFILLFTVVVGAFLVIAWNVLRLVIWMIVELYKMIARRFAKPATTATHPKQAAYSMHLTEDSLPSEFHGATIYVIKRLAADGMTVEQGIDVLQLSVAGHIVSIQAQDRGTIEHHKATGDTVALGEPLFTTRSIGTNETDAINLSKASVATITL